MESILFKFLLDLRSGIDSDRILGFAGHLDLASLSPVPQSPASPSSAVTTPSSATDAVSPLQYKSKMAASPGAGAATSSLQDLPKLETEPKLEHLGRNR